MQTLQRILTAWCVVVVALTQPADAQTDASPYGVAASASSYKDHAEWFPKMREAGVTTVRLFPEWGTSERVRDQYNWAAADAVVKAAGDNGLRINGIFMGSTPWAKAATHTFPVDHLDDWADYAGAAAGRYKEQIRHWEVWNEGNGGFNSGKHTTADYARLAAAAYAGAKKASPDAQIGLSIASFDPAYLNQAILAMAKDGKPNSFDFLAIHPYEIGDGLSDADGEIPYLWMTRMLRDMLKSTAPHRTDAPIWITEVGRLIDPRSPHGVTEAEAARDLVKLYVMAMAQGIACTQWFEGRDPAGEQAGFGLIDRKGTPRVSYGALKTLTARLGPSPKCVGWIALGEAGRGYGFMFETAPKTNVLVAWMPAGMSDKTIAFAQDVTIVDSVTGDSTQQKTGAAMELTERAVYVPNPPADLLAAAKANAPKPYSWGGDHSQAESVSVTLGRPDPKAGIFQTGRRSTPHCTFPDGSTGLIVRGDQNVQFFVHPSFASFNTKEYHVRITIRRLAPGNLGMNLFHEVADSQGKTPYRNVGVWFGAKPGDEWQTHTWHVKDACFAKMWGYDISIRPEQSVPFALGKVEVSTKPFAK